MKKTTIILLCVLLLTVVTLTSVFATAGSAELAASASTAKPGETVEFVASLADFPEADAISVTVTASEGLTVQSGEWILGGFVRDYNNSQKIGIWGSTDTVDLTDKTDVFKLICQVKEPAVGQQNLTCEVTVTFRVMSNDELQGNVTATKTVTVSNPATGLELNKQSVTLDLSGTKIQQLTATVTPENTTDTLSWSSDDNTVATVSPQGEVTAVSEGTATITATIGALTKTCTVTVSCSHAEKTAHPANSSTCQQNGNNLYYTCDVCGDAFKADQTTSTTAEAEKLPLEDHQGGEASCSQQAKCKWCQQPYGNTLPHDFSEKIEDAAHFVAGSGADCQSLKQYYFDCADCDAVGTTTFNSTTYGEHQMSTQWTSENDTHFHKCTVTGCTHTEDLDDCSGGTATCEDLAVCTTCQKEYGQLAACDFTAQNPTQEYLVSGATCTAKAVYHVSCSVCGAEGTDTFTYGDFADHDFSEKIEDAAHFVPGSGADCQHLKQYYFDCANCTEKSNIVFDSTTYGEHQMSTQWTSENDTHFHKCTVTGCTHTEDTADCSGGTATCTQKAECDVCQQPYGSTLPHNYSQQWSVTGTGDTDKHYYLCTSCQVAKDSEGTHSFAWVVDSHPTEDDTGMKHEECSVCHVKRSEGTVMDKLPHQHIGITHYPEVKANCQSTGTLEYWTCSSPKCANIYYGDQNFETKLTDIVIAIDPDNHLHTETRDQLAANCYEKGYTGDVWCLDCGEMANQGSEILATGNHVAGAEFHTDELNHWHICTTTGCGAEVGKTEHAYQWKVDSEATEDVTGIKHEECVCGVKRNDNTVIEKLDHVHVDIVHHKAVKATCVSEGTVEYWTCSSPKCEGKYYGDEECQSEISELTEQINKDNHAGLYVKGRVEATCSENGYTGDTWCSKCGASVRKGEIALATGKHTSQEDYLTDKDAHWHVCDCGEIFDKDTHTLEVVDAKEATQTEAGYTGDKVCSVCGYVAETGEEIPVETQPTEETQPQTKPESGDHDSSDLTVPVVIAVVVVVALAPAIVLLKKRIK